MDLLSGLRVVEGSAFVAAPLGGLTLAQLGADVIRFDTIGGGLDYRRWPVTEEGVSLYWAGLNKGKRSIAINLSKPEGRALATTLITAPGDDAGIFLSNFPESGWLSDARLREQRADLVYLNIVGNPDESTAVDYTVNAASGIATATGPVGSLFPVNNALPAWDIATGLNAVIGILAAERHRRTTGEGQLVKLSLADVAFTMVANLGFLAQAQVTHENRPPLGNDMYGAFGRDFATRDGRRVMVVAISLNQWHTLVAATGIEEHLAPMERAFNADFRKEEDRYRARDGIAALVEALVRGAHARRGHQGARRARRVLGPVPDVHAVARRRLARVARQPRVRRRRPSRHRRAAHPRVAAAVPDRSAVPAGTGAVARHAHRRGARFGARPVPRRDRAPARRRHRRGRSAARFVSVGVSAEPTLADAGFAERAHGAITREHAARLAACIDADPAVLDAGTLPLLWHWACFLPLVATAHLGRDGHPQRRPEMAAFPQRMWVGGRVQLERPLRLDGDAARSSRIVRAEPKDGGSGRFWLVTVGHVVSQDDEVCIDEEQDLVFREASAVATPGPDRDDATHRAVGGGAGRRPRALVPVLRRHRERAPHPLRPAVRHGVEGYPDLVVHGPLTAILLAELGRRRGDRAFHAVSYRARAPHFANHPFWLTGTPHDDGVDLAAVRADHTVAMTLELR